jgi:hypothetical protein
MKKPRVIIKTVTSHQIYIEHDGELVLYALTPKLERAKRLVQKAKHEFGIAKPRKRRGTPKTSDGLFQVEPEK